MPLSLAPKYLVSLKKGLRLSGGPELYFSLFSLRRHYPDQVVRVCSQTLILTSDHPKKRNILMH
jgi:hypothetical protein